MIRLLFVDHLFLLYNSGAPTLLDFVEQGKNICSRFPTGIVAGVAPGIFPAISSVFLEIQQKTILGISSRILIGNPLENRAVIPPRMSAGIHPGISAVVSSGISSGFL